MDSNDPRVLERWNALQTLLIERANTDQRATEPMLLVFRAAVPIEEIGARKGDLIVLDPTDGDHPVALYRPLPPTSVVDLVRRLGELELLLPHDAHRLWTDHSRGVEEKALGEMRRRRKAR